MIEWMRFALIVSIAAADHIAREILVSVNTTWEFVSNRGRWIVQEKVRALLARLRS
jgi:hypothetical protein